MQATRMKQLWMGVGLCAAFLSAHAVGPAMAATAVTFCGQVVRGKAFLASDLDCSGTTDDAVILGGGTLDLRGFTLTGNNSDIDCTVHCTRSCKITSDPPGGTITGGGVGVCDWPTPGTPDPPLRSLRVTSVTIDGNVDGGVQANIGRVLIRNSTLSNNGTGVNADSVFRGRLRVINSTITNNRNGFKASISAVVKDSVVSGSTHDGGRAGEKLVLRRSQVTGSGNFGLTGGAKMRIVDSEISGNGQEGISTFSDGPTRLVRATIDGNGGSGVDTRGFPARIIDSTITNNGGHGVEHNGGTPLDITGSTITGNALHGIAGGTPVRVVDSVVTGNGTGADCGVTMTCADVAALRLPKLKNTTCETSYDATSGFPGQSWGVCSLD